MKAHFIDLSIVLNVSSKPWIVSKESPNIPILKLDPSDMKVFQSGIYRSQNNKIEFNGKVFWLSDDFMNRIKLAAKKSKVDVSNLAISLQEYMNPELIENVPFDLNLSVFTPIVNTDDDIYIICSKNTKVNYQKQIQKFEENLKEIGLMIKNYYFISETFLNRNEDDIAHKKVRLLLQHLVGLKTEGDKFTEEEITQYQQISFYDDSKSSIELAKRVNNLLENLLIKTESEVKVKIKDSLKSETKTLVVKDWIHKKWRGFDETNVQLKWSNVIKNFENYQHDKRSI